jgi:hypothetical protein
MSDGRAPEIRFVPADAVRFCQGAVDVSGCASLDSARQAVFEACSDAAANADGRPLVIRLSVSGRTTTHRELTHADNLQQLRDNLREELLALEPWVWLERLSLETRGTYDVEAQRQRQDFVGDLVSVYDGLLSLGPDDLERLRAETELVFASWGGRRYLDSMPPDAVRELAEQAMRQTLDLVVAED